MSVQQVIQFFQNSTPRTSSFDISGLSEEGLKSIRSASVIFNLKCQESNVISSFRLEKLHRIPLFSALKQGYLASWGAVSLLVMVIGVYTLVIPLLLFQTIFPFEGVINKKERDITVLLARILGCFIASWLVYQMVKLVDEARPIVCRVEVAKSAYFQIK